MQKLLVLFVLLAACALLPILVAQLVSPGPLSSAHQSFAGQCTACHTPG